MHSNIKLAEVQASCRQCSLSELCLPRGLNDEELTDLEKVVDQLPPIDKHQYLYRNGDKFKSFYAVKSGAMKSVFTSIDGEEQIVGFHLPGELVGLDGLNTKRHTCDCIVLERSSVCELPSMRMEELCQRYSSLHRAMHSIIGKTISEDQSMLLLLARRSAEERLRLWVRNVVLMPTTMPLTCQLMAGDRELMLALCWELAGADGSVDRAERAYFEGIAKRLGVEDDRAAELRGAVMERLSAAPPTP